MGKKNIYVYTGHDSCLGLLDSKTKRYTRYAGIAKYEDKSKGIDNAGGHWDEYKERRKVILLNGEKLGWSSSLANRLLACVGVDLCEE